VIWVVIVIAAVVVLLVLILVGMFNRLVRLRNRAENAWAQVDVQLRKRYDLIPNLVEAVKGYAQHERETFEAVTNARVAAQQAQGVAQQAAAENALTAAIGRLFAVAEAYPQLRATENFQQLQAQLSDVEQSIAVARQVYNDTVLSYDNALETVPTNVIAGIFNFRPREYFQTEDATRAVPQVRFGEPQAGTPVGPPAAPPEPSPPATTPESPSAS
jgi:LemA protein